MTPQQIMDGMAEKNRMLSMKNDELVKLYESYAEAEREYNIAYAKKLQVCGWTENQLRWQRI